MRVRAGFSCLELHKAIYCSFFLLHSVFLTRSIGRELRKPGFRFSFHTREANSQIEKTMGAVTEKLYMCFLSPPALLLYFVLNCDINLVFKKNIKQFCISHLCALMLCTNKTIFPATATGLLTLYEIRTSPRLSIGSRGFYRVPLCAQLSNEPRDQSLGDGQKERLKHQHNQCQESLQPAGVLGSFIAFPFSCSISCLRCLFSSWPQNCQFSTHI